MGIEEIAREPLELALQAFQPLKELQMIRCHRRHLVLH